MTKLDDTTAIRPLVKRFLSDERGATAIEYAMIASGIAVAIANDHRVAGLDRQWPLYQRRDGDEISRGRAPRRLISRFLP